MNKVAIFVQNNHVLFNSIPVAQYAWRRPDIDLVDRSSTMMLNADDCGVDWSQYDVIVPYGSVQFMRNLLNTSLRDRVFYDIGNNWRTELWSEKFGRLALNHRGQLLKVADVPQLLAAKGVHHIRPSYDDKAFNGKVYSEASWVKMLEEKPLREDLEVVASPEEHIVEEYRCWVVAGKVIEISQYMLRGELELQRMTPEHYIWHEAQKLADVFLPEDIVVMDVCELEDGEVKFLEFNSFHSSGWYHASIDHILDTTINYLLTGTINDYAPN